MVYFVKLFPNVLLNTRIVELLGKSIAQPCVKTKKHQQFVVAVGANLQQLVAIEGQSWLSRAFVPPVLIDLTGDMLEEVNVILGNELK